MRPGFFFAFCCCSRHRDHRNILKPGYTEARKVGTEVTENYAN
jgi:hypothetical protein